MSSALMSFKSNSKLRIKKFKFILPHQHSKKKKNKETKARFAKIKGLVLLTRWTLCWLVAFFLSAPNSLYLSALWKTNPTPLNKLPAGTDALSVEGAGETWQEAAFPARSLVPAQRHPAGCVAPPAPSCLERSSPRRSAASSFCQQLLRWFWSRGPPVRHLPVDSPRGLMSSKFQRVDFWQVLPG